MSCDSLLFFQISLSSHTRNDYLSDAEKEKKMDYLQAERRTLKRKLDSCQQILQEAFRSQAVDLDDETSKDLSDIITEHSNAFEAGSLQDVFLKQQLRVIGKDKRGIRWHPAVIKLCIGLHFKSPSCYDAFRRILTLPSAQTLRHYTFFTKPVSGYNIEVIRKLANDNNMQSCPDHQRNIIVAFDEIKIKEGLVYNANNGRLLGWTDLGDVNQELDQILNGDSYSKEAATHVNCFMARGLFLHLDEVYGYFFTKGVKARELFYTMWRGIHLLELAGFRVRGIVADGAKANRKLFSLNTLEGQDKPIHYCYHLKRPGEKVYFFADVPHLLKTTRNNWEKSHWNTKTKNLMVIAIL